MKKIILSALAFVFATAAFAQEKIKEGTIIYTVEYQLPDAMKPYASFFPREATVYFKGDSAKSVQVSTRSTTSVITDINASFMRLLLEAGVKKVYVSFTPAQQEEGLMALPEYAYTAGTETKTIGGYKALKYDQKNKKTGVSSEAWFTKDVSVVQNSLTAQIDESLGLPLVFTAAQANGLTIKVTFKELKAGPVAAGTFSTPKDFQSIAIQDLTKIMTGG
ncbi:hypothetical protein [Hufsiella ginkgonis]|uniref:DUF4412 domain-containing protein n=1 Tax=Hufsiella ginkgonis TaxID=2695274 RepID=A0A7K1XWZ5_9SPHI|nr:hypothetical protein [Hufsiella ginkgonis]MXV15534.1 hypothetical protein [Hufsiella ginkgonis]